MNSGFRMTSLYSTIKNCLIAMALIGFTTAATAAPEFSMRRGISLDIWNTWPDESSWDEPEVLLPFPEWRRSLTKEDLSRLKSSGFDFVRIPVDPSVFLSEKTIGFRRELRDSVLQSVRLVTSAGLKAVVDLHLIPAGPNRRIGTNEVMEDPGLFEDYLEVVRAFGRLLSREDPSKVAFELMNEPIADCDDAGTRRWPGMLKRLFAAARSSATRLTLVLTGGCWSGAEALAAIDPRSIPDNNIIWTFHTYDPFLLTHQGATWAGDFIRHVRGIPYPPHSVSKSKQEDVLAKIGKNIRRDAPLHRRSGMISYLDELFGTIDTPEELSATLSRPVEQVSRWARKHGIDPGSIFLGEFGMIHQEYGSTFSTPAKWRAAYINDMIDIVEDHGFAWSLWSYGGAFGLVESHGGDPLPGAVLPLIRTLR